MTAERAHAHLGPSSASRWMACPASIRMSEGIERRSRYADEGTAAHEYVEIEARAELIGPRRHGRHAQWTAAHRELFDAEGLRELQRHAAEYVELLRGLLDAEKPSALLLEQQVQTGIPDCWGTADAVVVTPNRVTIVDFKYGAGQQVTVEGNPQLMLYGVGALETYGELLGEVSEVSMVVHQPRAGGISEATVSADDLRAWRDGLKPVAAEALAGSDRFAPGVDTCRFCPASGVCRAQADAAVQVAFSDPDADVMDAEALAGALDSIPLLQQWIKAVQAAAQARLSDGDVVPGWKLVQSRGRAAVRDPAHAIQRLIDAGYAADEVAEFKVKPLGTLDKVVGGRDALADLLGDLLGQSEGAPTLAPASDNRPELNPLGQLMNDFA